MYTPSRYPYLGILTVVAFAYLSSNVSSQTLLEVNFDQRASLQRQSFGNSNTYTESNVAQDFGELEFSNGVDEGRVQLVSDDRAFGNSGASLMVEFPANSAGPSEGGAQWLVALDEGLEEAYLSYRVKFGDGFDFLRGGKLPGLAGGTAPSGSVPADGYRGWAGRMMWRTDFSGVSGQPQQTTTQAISYAKHVNSGFDQNGKQEDTEFWFERDGTQASMQSGVWYTLRQHVRMNTPGVRDGVLRIWLDGKLVIDRNDIKFRNHSELKIDRLFFSTFFGGGDDWKTSKNEVIFFDDFKITVPQQRLVPEQYGSVEAAVYASNPGDTILLGSADWYGNLYLDRPLTLRGRGNTTLMAAQGNRPVIQINSDSVTIENIKIARGAVGVEAYFNSHGLKIQSCNFENNFGDAIRASGCRDISIQNTNLNSNEGRGVFLNQVEGFYINSCEANNNGGAGFELFSNGGFVSNCLANSNRAGAGFFYIGNSSGFQNNRATNNQGMGFLLVNARYNGFSNNTADNNSTFGLLAYGVDDSYFSGNLFQRSGDVGVIFDNSKRNAFVNNESSVNRGIGAYFSPSTSSNYSAGNQYQKNAFSLGLIDQGNNTVE